MSEDRGAVLMDGTSLAQRLLNETARRADRFDASGGEAALPGSSPGWR